MQTAANDIAERAKSSGSDTDEAIKAVDGMINRVENLKRKVWSAIAHNTRLSSPISACITS